MWLDLSLRLSLLFGVGGPTIVLASLNESSVLRILLLLFESY